MDADHLAKRVLSSLAQPAELNVIPVEVGGSIGIALYPTHSADAGELLRHADIAMYAAKRGRTGTAVYQSSGDDGPLKELSLV